MKTLANAALLCLALLSAPMLRAEDPAPTSTPGNEAKPPAITITPDKETVMPGEPFYITVAGGSKMGRRIFGPQYIPTTGSVSWPITPLEVRDASGAAVEWRPELDEDYGYRLIQYHFPESVFSREKQAMDDQSRAAFNSDSKRVLLMPDFKKPGEYTFAVADWGALSPQTPKLTVAPYDREKMAAVVDELGKSAMSISGPATVAQLENWEKLDMIKDDLAVPWLVRLVHGDDNLMRLRAVHALRKFNNDTVLDTLEQGARFTAKDIPGKLDERDAASIASEVRHQAADAILDSSSPGAFPFLIKTFLQPGGDWLDSFIFLGLEREKLSPKEALPLALQILKHGNFEGYDLRDLKNMIASYNKRLAPH